MSKIELSRRGILKTSLFGAAGAAALGITGAAQAKPKKPEGKFDAEYDAVVLGAGPSGLITAITAHDLGAKVVVCEKMARPDGNAI